MTADPSNSKSVTSSQCTVNTVIEHHQKSSKCGSTGLCHSAHSDQGFFDVSSLATEGGDSLHLRNVCFSWRQKNRRLNNEMKVLRKEKIDDEGKERFHKEEATAEIDQTSNRVVFLTPLLRLLQTT